MTNNAPTKYVFKKDRYLKNRGGNSCFLDIFCSKCNNHIALYQKDGPGSLLRMYLDRIFAPPELVSLQGSGAEKKNVPNLQCGKCHTIIGVPMVYKPENRLAFRLIRGLFVKKSSDGIYPPSKL